MAWTAWAEPEHDMTAAPAGSAELKRIKPLAGRWEGTSREGAAEAQPAVIEYQVTSGGSAVVETLLPGTPHEMVSVYHDAGGRLAMTHYCMLKNQPHLALIGGDDQRLEFSLVDGSGIQAAEEHMHGLSLAWDSPDRLTQTWSCYKDGQPKAEATVISVSRVR